MAVKRKQVGSSASQHKPAAKGTAKPATIDEYLAKLPDDQRSALEKLRHELEFLGQGPFNWSLRT